MVLKLGKGHNVSATHSLLQAMIHTGHKNIIFSSTAAVYGNPKSVPITERHELSPINPYGKTKLHIEQLLKDLASSGHMNSVCLRYFNAAGAHKSGHIGEKHNPETHLIPNILKSIAAGNVMKLKVFGDNYETSDGTCIRDYIHVSDLASAHVAAGNYLLGNSGIHVFNIGMGKGFSVLDVISATELVTGIKVNYTVSKPRDGDPPILVANAQKANLELNWTPKHNELAEIIETAWRWHKNGELFL
jgi:UDP-glucose 4-epimerase